MCWKCSLHEPPFYKQQKKKSYSLEKAPRKVFEEENLSVRFNYRYIDDDYLIDLWKPEEIEDKSDVMSKVTIESEEDAIPVPYTIDKKMLVENHPLSYLISNKRQTLICKYSVWTTV